MDDIVIRVVEDTSGIDTTINKLKGLGDVAGDQAQKFDELNNSAKASADGIDNTTKSAGKLDNQLRTLATTVGLAFAANRIMGFTNSIIALTGRQEKLNQSYKIFLKDGEKVKQLVKDIEQFALKTPFEGFEIDDAVRSLLSMGIAAEDVIDKMRILGDIASGTGTSLNELAFVYGKLRTVGKATQQDLNSIARKGIPIFETLAEITGTNVEQVRNMNVTFEMLDAAFQRLAGSGGMFFGMMEAQADTSAGALSNMRGAIDILKIQMGEKLAPVITMVAQKIQGFVEGLDPNKMVAILSGVMGVVSGFITLNAVLLTTKVIITALSKNKIVGLLTLIGSLAVGVLAAKGMQKAMSGANEAMRQMQKESSSLASITERVNEEMNKEVAKVTELLMLLGKTKTGTAERAKGMQQLSDKYGIILKDMADEKEFLKQINVERDKYLDRVKQEIALQIHRERLEVVMKNQIGLEKQLSKLAEERLKVMDAINNRFDTNMSDQQLDKFMNKLEDIAIKAKYLSGQLLVSKGEVEKLGNEMSDTADKLREFFSFGDPEKDAKEMQQYMQRRRSALDAIQDLSIAIMRSGIDKELALEDIKNERIKRGFKELRSEGLINQTEYLAALTDLQIKHEQNIAAIKVKHLKDTNKRLRIENMLEMKDLQLEMMENIDEAGLTIGKALEKQVAAYEYLTNEGLGLFVSFMEQTEILFDNRRRKDLEAFKESLMMQLELAGDNIEKRKQLELQLAGVQKDLEEEKMTRLKAFLKGSLELALKAARAEARLMYPVIIARQVKDNGIKGLISAAALIALIEVAFAGANSLVQQFNEGTDFVQRKGHPKGVDTIPAMLNEGEAVLTTQMNAKYKGLAAAINADKVPQWLAKNPHMIGDLKNARQAGFADRVAASLLMPSNFDDTNIVSELVRNRMADRQIAEELINVLSKKRSIRD